MQRIAAIRLRWALALVLCSRIFAAQYLFTTYSTGVGGAAAFTGATGVAIDPSGNQYVTDAGSYTIRKITPGGVVSTFAGIPNHRGTDDGPGYSATFTLLNGISCDGAGNVYVWDGRVHEVANTTATVGGFVPLVRKITPAGVVSTIFQGNDAWRLTGDAAWWDPGGFAVDSTGNIYLHDSNHDQFCKILSSGQVTILANRVPASIRPVQAMAIDPQGDLFYVDGVALTKISSTGQFTTMLHPDAQGLYNGPGGKVQLGVLGSLATDSSGNVYASDQEYAGVYKIAQSGDVTLVAGGNGNGSSSDGNGRQAYFENTRGLVVDSAGNIFVADYESVRKVTPAGDVTTVAGCPPLFKYFNGIGTAHGFSQPCAIVVGPGGVLFVADRTNHAIRKVLQDGSVSTMAGKLGQPGDQDGAGVSALLNSPHAIKLDGAGNLYVAEYSCVRKITPAGVVTTFAGSAAQIGSADGVGPAARFYGVGGLAIDSGGNLFVVDGNNTTIRKITPDGTVTTFAGLAGQRGTDDGTGSAARFWAPGAIAVDNAGNLFVTDYGVLRKITGAGVVTTVAGVFGQVNMAVDGPTAVARFYGLSDLVVTPTGDLVILESNGLIRVLDATGTVTTIVGPYPSGAADDFDGIGSTVEFRQPAGLALDPAGNIYVADSGNNSIRKGVPLTGDIPAITTDPFSTYFEVGGMAFFNVTATSGLALTFQWQVQPAGAIDWRNLADDGSYVGTSTATLWILGVPPNYDGNAYRCVVSNAQNSNISMLATLVQTHVDFIQQPVDTMVNDGFYASFSVLASGVPDIITSQWQQSIDGGATWTNLADDASISGTHSSWLNLAGVTQTMTGYEYRCVVDDGLGNPVASTPATLTVPAGSPCTFSTVAHVGRNSYDTAWNWYGGSGANAVAVDHAGTIYVAMTYNHVILKIVPNGVVANVLSSAGQPAVAPNAAITALAGAEGYSGTADGIGSNARFYFPSGIAVDESGNVFVSDSGNHTIRKIAPNGLVSTVAGSAGQFGYVDGKGSAARFWSPSGVAVDKSGNVYVAEGANSAIRKIAPDGSVTTVAGGRDKFNGGWDGPAATARFSTPQGIAVDGSGNIFVADSHAHTIRKITPDGMVTTIAGSLFLYGTTDGEGANALFYYPVAVAADGIGNVYVADQAAGLIRKIGPDGNVTTVGGKPYQYDPGDQIGFFSDGIGAGARFCSVAGLAADKSGAIYVVDAGDAAVRVGTLNLASPAIATQPVGRLVDWGGAVTLTAMATGSPTPTYQWQKDGVNITGAVDNTYTIDHATAGDVGTYSVVVTNIVGSITSDGAVLQVAPIRADFDGDGKADLLLSNSTTGERDIWLMNGTSVGSIVSLGNIAPQWSAVAGDFNGDGKADLVWSNTVTGDRYIWLMNGTSVGSDIFLGNVAPQWTVVTGDFNGDGQSDLLWSNTATGDRYIWLMNGTSIGSSVYLANRGPRWLVAGTGDFNGDGQTDIVWQNTVTGECSIWLMSGTHMTSSVSLGLVSTALRIAMVGDYNGDGQTDLVWQNIVTGECLVWLMNGTDAPSSVSLGVMDVHWTIGQNVIPTPAVQASSDFNADGQSDLLWSNTTTGERYLWLMNGTSAGSSIYLGNIAPQWTVATGDFNADGQSDLLWSNASTGDRYLWLMNGSAVASSVYLGNVAPQWTVVTGDFNADGQSDLLWSNTTTGDRYVWLMNGTAVSSSVFLGTVAPQWTVVTGDFNADGQTDLLWSDTTTGDRYFWLMNGTAVSSSVFLATIAPQWTIVTGDFNADGQSDLLWSNTANGDRYVWLMNGTSLNSSVFLATVAPVWEVAP